MCRACADLDKEFHIPRSTPEHLYEEDLSQSQIAERLGCSPATVLRRMEKYGIKARPRGGVPKALVPGEVLQQWSPELAHAVGLVTSDGNLAKQCNLVSFSSTDYELIEIYQQCLRVSVHVVAYTSPVYLPIYTVRLSDPAYRAFLEDVGLTPAKSKTLRPLSVPDEFFRDFLRGCMDGDGHISAYPDRVCPNHCRLRFSLASSSRHFLAWVQDTIARLAKVRGTIYQKQAFALTFTGSKARRLLSWLYYAPDLPCLRRKRAVWRAYIQDN